MNKIISLLVMLAVVLFPTMATAEVKTVRPKATAIVELLKFGRENKDAYALFAAYRMIAKLPQQSPVAGKKAEVPKGASKVDVDPKAILDEAAQFAAGDKALLDQIQQARDSLPTSRDVCYYEYYCNSSGCWYEYACFR